MRFTPLEIAAYEALQKLVRGQMPDELARGFARYETLRRLNPKQFAELHARNLAGENFDQMVDSLVMDNAALCEAEDKKR